MIKTEEFYKELINNNIEFFTGVPDSLLKSFCAYIKDNVEPEKNITAANEGNAVAIASGYYLSTGKIGPVLLEVKVKKGARNDLGRPTKTPIENKEAFMKFLRESNE